VSGLACVHCRKFFRVAKVGVYFEEGMPLGEPQADGSPESWGPYKLWAADLCECPDCGTQILLTASSQRAVAEHYQPDYASIRERRAPIVRIDDCGGKRP
jgi:hypothetical protein